MTHRNLVGRDGGGSPLSCLSTRFLESIPVKPDGCRDRVTVGYRREILFFKLPMLQMPCFECLSVVQGDWDRMELWLEHLPPHGSTIFLQEWSELFPDVILEFPKLVVLEDFNVHAEAPQDMADQDFMAAPKNKGHPASI